MGDRDASADEPTSMEPSGTSTGPSAHPPSRIERGAGPDGFMSIVAHDLRNPIAVVRASAQMATRQLSRGDSGAAERRLQAIIEQTDRLNEMLEVFLEAARVEAGRLPLKPEAVDLAELVRGAVDVLPARHRDRGERPIELRLVDGTMAWVDRPRVERAVLALLDNAYLYGGPEAPVRVEMSSRDGRARLVVRGGGEGPTAAERPSLFARFYRGHAAGVVGHSGSGLGLYTARGTARALGGDVRHVPEVAPDAFVLELPLAPAGA